MLAIIIFNITIMIPETKKETKILLCEINKVLKVQLTFFIQIGNHKMISSNRKI